MIVTVLSLVLDIISYKWRQLTHAILYFECFASMLEAMIPVPEWNSITPLQVNLLMQGLFLGFYTDQAGQLVTVSATHIVAETVISSVIYR